MTAHFPHSFRCGVAVVAALLFCLPSAHAQTVDPDLRSVLDRLGPGDRVSVVVRFAGRPELRRLKGETRESQRARIVRELKATNGVHRLAVDALLRDPSVARRTALWAINGVALTAGPEVIRELADHPAVARVSLDAVITVPKSLPADAATSEWNLEAIRAPELWADGITGAGVVIGSMDTGVDETHPDLAPAYRGGSHSWFDPYGEHADPHDRTGHGTQSMGVMVGGSDSGTAIGVAPDAQWIAAKIFNDAGEATYSAIHAGFQWMLDPDGDPDTDDGADIVNNSWSLANTGTCSLEFEQDLRVLRAAGIAVVFSGGNYGSSPGSSVSPANNPSGFGVGFVNATGTIHISSGRGPSACDGTVYPKVVAPGVGVRTADLGAYYASASGASIAAPHVSGAMALLRSAHPEASVEALELALERTAVDLGALGPDPVYGHGLIDVTTAAEVLPHLSMTALATTVYTDEPAFLAAVGGSETVTEGFEDDGVWAEARSPDTLPSVTSHDITWTSNHPDNEVSTSGGAAYSGSWGFYSNPHGDQNVPAATDPIHDGFVGTSDRSMAAVGGWFTGTFGGQLTLILDGDEANPVELGPVDSSYRFYGVVADGSFSTFEFREVEGTREDQKYIFVDDVTIALADPGTAPSMDGVIAGAASLPGAHGSEWHTDLFLHNPSSADITAELYFSPEGDTIGAPGTTVTVLPNETRAFEDVVAGVFGVQASGAISWRVIQGDVDGLHVSANTYNRVNAARRYGQQIDGMRWSDASPAGSRVIVPALAGRYRTNLGLATDGDCTIVTVRGYDRTSRLVAQETLQVRPWSWLQLNSLFRQVFPNLIERPDFVSEADSLHRFEVVGINGRVVAYTSIIDNATSDGSYMVGQVPAADSSQWLPGAAAISGANDSEWRSDVVAISTAGTVGSMDVAYFPAGEDNGGFQVRWNVPLGISESVFLGDILTTLFGASPPAVGSLSVSSAQSQPLLWMRTYTEESVAGGDLVTYGQAILPRTSATTVVGGAEGRVSGFSHDETTRANLILQNTRAADDGTLLSTTARVELLTADGSVLHEQTYTLLPGEYRQHNRFVDAYGTGPVQHASLRVTVLDPPQAGDSGGVDAMVSEVNGNTVAGTNDSRLIRADVVP